MLPFLFGNDGSPNLHTHQYQPPPTPPTPQYPLVHFHHSQHAQPHSHPLTHTGARRAFLPVRNFPSRLTEQDFGLQIDPNDVLTTSPQPLQTEDYCRTWRHRAHFESEIGSNIKTDKNKMTINLDVLHFAPEELTVKIVGKFIVVQGKHEERKDDHGFISRKFTRRYPLPEAAAAENVESRVSSDGVLTIIIPRKVPDLGPGELNVKISQTGPIRKEIQLESQLPKPQVVALGGVPPQPQLYQLVQNVSGINPVPAAEAVAVAPAAAPAAQEGTAAADDPSAEHEQLQK